MIHKNLKNSLKSPKSTKDSKNNQLQENLGKSKKNLIKPKNHKNL